MKDGEKTLITERRGWNPFEIADSDDRGFPLRKTGNFPAKQN